ncbi:MAG: hypothetical protein LUG18_05515 [Candidatus Azobacteroides sp.]|nr:hypothetical protein [Candidatus Azobacteroides sp.]
MKFDAEFKKAISLLPSAEKDKLLLRLLKRDRILASRLHFLLLKEETLSERRSKMADRVRKEMERMNFHFYSFGYLLTDVRSLSAEITEHVKITLDKYGEVSLNLLMLIQLIKLCTLRIAQSDPKVTYKLNMYIIARAFKILVLIQSLNEDYRVEFEDDMKELGQLIGDNPVLMDISIKNGFNINWLIQTCVPDDIEAIYKENRSRGFLR